MYCVAWKALLFLVIFTDFYNTWAKDDPIESQGEDGQGEKIFEGKPVNPPHSRPYIVQLMYTAHVAGAVVYDKWTIVAVGYRIETVTKILAGKFYNHNNDLTYNYGIIHLREPLIFNEYVQPAKFFVFGSGGGYPATNCKIAGWGRVSAGEKPEYSEVLRETSVTVLPNKECNKHHFTIECISKGACYYDDGGPVTCRGNGNQDIVIAQVISARKHCGPPGEINVLAQLPQPWFDDEVKKATKLCRAPTTPPPPPPTTPAPNDCCNNDGKVNGDLAIPHSRPFVVQIHMENSKDVSIGVLINAYTIVTSAHQVDNVRKISAGKHFFGKYEGTQQTRSPCSTSKHPENGKPENAFDYGLIHLADPFVFNEYVNSIGLAPAGDKPIEECSIIAWQQTSPETQLREQKVTFKDPSACKNVHETITCVKGGACLHELGSPVICSHDSKIFFHAIVSSTNAYCKDGILSSIAELPRSWLATELRKAETTCGKSIR